MVESRIGRGRPPDQQCSGLGCRTVGDAEIVLGGKRSAQLKISTSALDLLGLPLSTTIVSGECADDPHVPEIQKVQANLEHHGVLYVGDCKMSALPTRAHVAQSQDYYLCPLSAVQMSAPELQTLLAPVLSGQHSSKLKALIPLWLSCCSSAWVMLFRRRLRNWFKVCIIILGLSP